MWIAACLQFRRLPTGCSWLTFPQNLSVCYQPNFSHRPNQLLNAYRVLLTRARQGLIVFVPHGDAQDATRPPAFYDETYAFLVSCGIPEI